MRRTLLLIVLILSACTSDTAPTGDATTIRAETAAANPTRQTITVPLTLHVVVEAGAPDSDISSTRTTEDVREIAAAMESIWRQADIVFDPIHVHRIEMPSPVLQGIVLGSTDQFFDQVNVTFVPENSQAINGFYVRSAFGVNGFTPQGSNLFFVVDEPSVHDERVSSHEVGHIFGLHHDLTDPTRLMFSGTNGTALTELEQTVARYSVQGLFPQGIDP